MTFKIEIEKDGKILYLTIETKKLLLNAIDMMTEDELVTKVTISFM